MIPKIIHYVWFGGKPYPKKIQYCIDSWKRFLPDYEFKRWDESNFDVNSVAFTRQAFEKGVWAFVSDYVRIQALYEYGGWYLDTDVEVLKPLAPFEGHRVVLGTDENGCITAVYGTEPHHPLWKAVMDIYHSTNFMLADGSMNAKVINQYIQDVLVPWGYVKENKYQQLQQGVVVYPDDYFHVQSLEKGTRHFTENSTCIHWQTMLWTPVGARIRRWIRIKILKPILGEEKFLCYYNRITNLFKRREK